MYTMQIKSKLEYTRRLSLFLLQNEADSFSIKKLQRWQPTEQS